MGRPSDMDKHLSNGTKKLKKVYGNINKVNYMMAKKIVGSTLAARLTARGVLLRADGTRRKTI